MASQWKYKAWTLSSGAAIADWISACGPQDASGIRAFVAPDKGDDERRIHVWCRADRRPVEWARASAAWVADAPGELASEFESGRVALLGCVAGQSGETVLLVRRST
jgi:hypothetical protein